MRDLRKTLVEHVGNHPSVSQTLLIDRVVNLQVRVAAMDRKFAETGVMTPYDTTTYLAWSAALSRLVSLLGMTGTEPKAPTLAELRAAHAPAQRAA